MKRFFLCLVIVGLEAVGACAAEYVVTSSLYGYTPMPTKTPYEVSNLLTWPGPEVLATKGVDTNKVKTIAAQNGAASWLGKVLNPSWISSPLHPVCTRAEFQGRDVIRYRWTKDGYRFLVGQTPSIFAMAIESEKLNCASQTKEEKVALARSFATNLFATTGSRMRNDSSQAAIERLNEKIAQNAFDAGFATERTNGGIVIVSGRSKTLKEAGGYDPQSGEVDYLKNLGIIRPWEDTVAAWDFWFNLIIWELTSGKLVIYFLKDEAGPILIDYGYPHPDSGWFSVRYRPSLDEEGTSCEPTDGLIKSVQERFGILTWGRKMTAESYLGGCRFVATRGREFGFWRQVIYELQNGKKPKSERVSVEVLGLMLEIDALARDAAAAGKKAGSNELSRCLGPEVVKELAARGELADNFLADHYAIALARARVVEASNFFHSVLERKQKGGDLEGAQFHAALGLAQLGDSAGFGWLIAKTENTFPWILLAQPEGAPSGNLNACCVTALQTLAGRKDLKTRKDWESWWLNVDKKALGRHCVYLVDGRF